MTAWQNEPVRLIGVVGSVILAVVSTLLGQGVISDVLAGRVTDIVKSAGELLTLLAPIIVAEIGRTQVSPVNKS